MSAVFLPPLDYSIVSSDAVQVAPASRVMLDEPGLVARSAAQTLTMTFNMGDQSYDTIAVIGTNLLSSDRVRVRIGNNAEMTSGIMFDTTVQAWTGNPPLDKAITYIPLNNTFSALYVRIDITSSRTFVEVSRVIIGKRLEVDGIDTEPNITPVSGSIIDDGPGWTSADDYRTRMAWKANVGNVLASSYWTDWHPFLKRVGKHAGFLFIPQTESDSIQLQAGLMRHKEDANIVPVTYSRVRVELNLLEV